MRAFLLAGLAALSLMTDARAQVSGGGPAITATPLPPLQAQPGQPNQPGQPTQPTPNQAPPPSPWLPQGAAILQALDKVNAQSSTFTVKVGQTATFGTLSIKVTACVVQPPDRPADAAAFLAITDNQAGTDGFSGWMLKSEPFVSMFRNPIYDIRLMGCAA